MFSGKHGEWLLMGIKIHRILSRAKQLAWDPYSIVWKKLLSWLWMVVLVGVVGILGLMVWRNRDALIEVLRTARYEYFAWTFVTYSASIGAVVVGWHLILHHLGGSGRFSVNGWVYVSTLAARRLPGTWWYIVGRAVLYKRLGMSTRLSSLASGLEALLSIVSGLMVGALALLTEIETSLFQIIFFVLLEAIGLFLLYPNVLSCILAFLGHRVASSDLSVFQVMSWVGAYILMWITGGLMVVTIIAALHPLTLVQAPLIISIWSLTGVISFSTFFLPNSFGVSEITLSLFLSHIVPPSIAIATAILARLLTTLFDIVWSALFWWLGKGLLPSNGPE